MGRRIHWIQRLSVIALLGLTGASCDLLPEEKPDGGGGGGSQWVTCGSLQVVTEGSPVVVRAWPEGDTYGVNSFYLWEVDVSGPQEAPVFRFQEPAVEVTDQVPLENWQIPPTRWSAIRFALDGNDPYHFSAEDSFILGYLPYTPGSSWQSKTGATNDGTCPESDSLINGRHRCMGARQLDPQAPTTLASGRAWLVRMMMIIPMGTDGSGRKLNRVQSCYQKVFIQP